MSDLRRSLGTARGRAVRSAGALAAAGLHRVKSPSASHDGAVTVMTVNQNSLSCLRPMFRAVKKGSPAEAEMVVVDSASRNGSRDCLAGATGVVSSLLSTNAGHGMPLELASSEVTSALFGGLVYHNLYSTQGVMRDSAEERFRDAFQRHHPDLCEDE